jgi:predicted Zn-dependent protease
MARVLGGRGKWLAALLMVVIAIVTYCSSSSYNPITGENQYVGLSVEQEIALGLQSAPQMAQEFGGELANNEVQVLIDRVGQRLVQQSGVADSPYQFEFTVLADSETINAFALPGGPIFITAGLLEKLETEAQLAGVLAHEIVHVVGRHSSEQIAKSQLTQQLSGAAAVAAYDPENPNSSQQAAIVSAMVGQVINMRYGREDELESDRLGVRFMAEAGYDPRAMIRVMEILAEASSGPRPPEFFSTHPNPENRIQRIQEAIQEEFPNGLPEGLES